MEIPHIPKLIEDAEPDDPWGKLFARSLKLLFEEHAHHRIRLRAIEEAVLDLAEVVRTTVHTDPDRIIAAEKKIEEAYANYVAQSRHRLDEFENIAVAVSMVLARKDRQQQP